MAAQTFTPSARVSAESNPRDWAYELGCLSQTASIVFTKSSLIAYLKTHGIEVGPNNAEISKVPRFASIGTMSTNAQEPEVTAPAAEASAAQVDSSPVIAAAEPELSTTQTKQVVPPSPPAPVQTTSSSPAPVAQASSAFRPSRRVREPIGGGSAQISALFGMDGDDGSHEEALREASYENARRRGLLQEHNVTKSPTVHAVKQDVVRGAENDVPAAPSVFRPSRRVREPGGTGGSSSITLG